MLQPSINTRIGSRESNLIPLYEHLYKYPLVEALLERRSRRFGKGMHLQGGPLTYSSAQRPQPLTIEEEAALAFAACGITGYVTAEFPYERGGNKMTQFVGRTAA